TLVDGKFIYVSGLGERYSSARLNGAYIPSPELTRNVVPLDIFPASIIESMAVQKAYSPDMPAAFGGGNIDIRTKSIPSDFVAGVELGVGYNTTADEGYTYDGNDAGVPQAMKDAIVRYQGNFSINNIV
ncbi:TonB-dependent receptor, partial [Pseudoalteromonas sp. S3260]